MSMGEKKPWWQETFYTPPEIIAFKQDFGVREEKSSRRAPTTPN